MRAIETGRTVLIASTSGISGVVGPDGKVEHKSGQFVPDVYVASVPVRDGQDPGDRVGGWPQWLLTGLGIWGAVLALGRARRGRPGRPGEPSGGDPQH